MVIEKEALDKLLNQCDNPEDLFAKDGLIPSPHNTFPFGNPRSGWRTIISRS
jgi:hypothetical protein